MKKILFCSGIIALLGLSACKKSDFQESYADPSKVSTTTVEKQFTGFLATNREYVVPSYWNYFVVLRTSVNRYIQAVGWENAPNQYIPGAASIGDRWNNYYNYLSQYRELERVYSLLSADDQAARRIYLIAATIYFYDHTQKVVDLHGDIPWSEAGKLSANGGDYTKSLPKYDTGKEIYTKMLDDLKNFADELNQLTVSPAILTGFKNQDIVNKGELNLWKEYCNSLRLRMLTRASGSADFQSRANTEISQILANAAQYPIVSTNDENIQIKIHDLTTDINSQGFQTGLEDWNGNISGKVMIENMNTNADPRLRVMFEPGVNAGGSYTGLDPLLPSSTQNALINGGTLAIYNRSTISRNDYFPGILINAAEISFLLSEYYLNANDDASAKTAYENGIRQSVEYYYWLRTLSNDNTSGSVTPPDATEVDLYINQPAISWNLALTNADKLERIATQKWIHYSVIQPLESWAELRRLDVLNFSFEMDNSGSQNQPPVRWIYPGSELTYNAENYKAAQGGDNLSTKIFWDIQ